MMDQSERICPQCREPVLLRNARARFCCSDCRDKHHSRRNRALRESAVRLSEWAEQMGRRA